jgi:hypothetical protein
MGIDGIGGKPPIPKDALPTGGVSPSGETFDVRRSAPPSAAEASDTDRLLSGQIGVDEYLSARVEQATAHLQGLLSPAQLDVLRDQLREQLSGADPVVRRMLQQMGVSTPTGGDS